MTLSLHARLLAPAFLMFALAALASTPVAAQTGGGVPASAPTATPSPPAAQTAAAAPVRPRPKIGLVLSGGGARGAAHIGVLKVLEELRVPVDVIAGTSMGSIVGAAYATGMTVAEMEAAIVQISTRGLFTDKPPRADQTIRQKSDDLSPFLIPELGITKDGVALPKGIVTGVALEGELRKLVQIANVRSFDELPIPFRAIATDIGTGEMVVLKEGSVVQAIRASMSVPGAVAPVTIGKRQLVDGGLVRNLPIDVARQMGAEIIIAVNLGTPLLKPDEITSVLSVTFQMINILTEQNVNRSLKELRSQDILVVPELGNFSSGDFDNLIKTVPIGEAAAWQVADRLRALSLPPEQYAALRGRQAAPSETAPAVIQAIRVEGTQRVSPEVVLQALRSEVGQPLDRDTIDLDMRRVYGRGDFDNVNYTVEEVEGQHTLVILVKEKPERDFIRFGLELDADLGRQASFNVYASHRRKWMNAWGAEWRNDLVLGSDVLAATEFYQPIGPRQYFFVSPQLRYSITPWYLYSDGVRVAQYQDKSWVAQLDFGANIIEYGEVRIGALTGGKNFELQSGISLFPSQIRLGTGAVQASARFDRLDNLNFPHSGYVATAQVYSSTSTLGAEDTYNKWDVGANGAVTFGRHTIEAAVSGGGKIGSSELPIYDVFDLGGFLRLSGWQRQQVKARDYTFGRLTYRTKLADFTFFEGAYVGGSIEGARVTPITTLSPTQPPGVATNIFAGSLYFGVDSPLGPLYIGYGYSGRENSAVYLFLGRP
jgi:NTE family protein